MCAFVCNALTVLAKNSVVLACDDVSTDHSVGVAVVQEFRALSVLCVGRVRGDLSVAEQGRALMDLRVASKRHWRAVECHADHLLPTRLDTMKRGISLGV